MVPNCVKICIVCDDTFYSSLLKDFLCKEDSFFIYTSTFDKIPSDKDAYIIVTDKLCDMDKVSNINALKVLITGNTTKNMIIMALRCGISMFYDHTIDLNSLFDIGLHLYIYKIDTSFIDIPYIVKVVTNSKHTERRYGKIQI